MLLSLTAPAQCNPNTQTLRNNDPWLATFFYGPHDPNNQTLNLFFDLDLQVTTDIERLWITAYDQAAPNAPPDQVGNIAEARIYLVPGTRSGLEATPGSWGVSTPNSGLPEVRGELLITAWPEASPIQNFKDATGAPTTLTLAPGQYGVCVELIPTVWSGTTQIPGQRVPLMNPGPLHVVGVSPNPATTWSDSFVGVSNDGIMQNGWQQIDGSGALVPSVPSPIIDSINIAIDYVPSAPGLAGHSTFGAGCYDDPRVVYESFPQGLSTIDLVNTSWTLDFQQGPSGGRYEIRPGGPAFDVATAVQNGINLKSRQPTVRSSTRLWDDASLVWPLSTSRFATGFPFPGGNCSEITINSNGRVFLGSVIASSSIGADRGDVGKFLQWPQLAPFSVSVFVDLATELRLEDPSPNGGIRMTWHRARAHSTWCSMQVEILPDGDVFFAFGAELGTDGQDNVAFTGFSPGDGTRREPIDWSAITSLRSGSGSESPTLDLSAPPVIGTSIEAVIGNLDANVSQPFGGFVTISFRQSQNPLPLASLGLPGCNAHIDLGRVVLTSLLPNTGSGELRWNWAVPVTGAGVPVFLQGGVLTPNEHNALGIKLTNGVCAILGQ